jgi:hypothetical protein
MIVKWLLAVLVGLVILANVALASSSPTGTYKATISGEPAALNGRWQLQFRPKGLVRTVRNGKVVVVSKASWLANRRVRFADRSGPYACSSSEGNGTYGYRLSGNRLTFRVIRDKCVGRKLVLTTRPFVKKPASAG